MKDLLNDTLMASLISLQPRPEEIVPGAGNTKNKDDLCETCSGEKRFPSERGSRFNGTQCPNCCSGNFNL